MAITNNTLPEFIPAYNDTVIVATSTNNAQDNFRLSLKIETWNGSSYDTAFEALIPKRPDNNIIFNLKDVLRALVMQSIQNAKQLSTFEANTGLVQVRINLQEYYGTPPQLQGSVSQQVVQVFAGWLDSYMDFDPTDYVITNASAGKWLSLGTSQDATLSQPLFLSAFVEDYSGGLERIQVKSFDIGGNEIGTENITVSGITDTFFCYNFKLEDYTTLVTGAHKFTFQGQTSGGAARTDTYTINVIHCPSKHDIVTLYWCNVFGAVQSMDMIGRPVNTREGDRENAEFISGDVSGADWVTDRLEGGVKTIHIERKNRYLLNTGLISLSEFRRLSECLQSYPLAVRIDSELFNCVLITSELQQEPSFPNPSNYQLIIQTSKP